MAQELQKQSAEIVAWTKQPEKFLERIGATLNTFQKVYRTQLPADELVMWRETLKDYSAQEFEDALAYLVKNPPKYELEDGTIQTWRGMPKLPDVLWAISAERERTAREAREAQSKLRVAEWKQLEKRRAEHPEEFMGWPEFFARLRIEHPALAALIRPQPTAEPTGAELAEQKREAIAVAEKFKAAK